MFENCNSLTSIELKNLDTSKVTNMKFMFSHCKTVEELNTLNFDTSQVIDMTAMFEDCPIEELDLKNFYQKSKIYAWNF